MEKHKMKNDAVTPSGRTAIGQIRYFMRAHRIGSLPREQVFEADILDVPNRRISANTQRSRQIAFGPDADLSPLGGEIDDLGVVDPGHDFFRRDADLDA